MNPGTLQTGCQIIMLFGAIVIAIAGYGNHYYGKKVAAIQNTKQQENQQATNSKLDKILGSIGSDNKTKLLEKYPAGYVLFGIDLSTTFSSGAFPHRKEVLTEYEFDWDKVKIEKLTSTSLTILMPDIRYKPFNARFIGNYKRIPRRPLGKEYIYPVKPAGTLHRIFVELLEDNNQQLIFVIGLRKVDKPLEIKEGDNKDAEPRGESGNR
jgi:hypothetical protein